MTPRRIILLAIIATLPLSCSKGDTWKGPSDAGISNGSDGTGPSSDLSGLLPDGGGQQTDAIQGCDPLTFSLEQAPPAEVYLVLDRSGSMNEQGSDPAVTKWQELQDAVDFVLQQFESSIHFGLLTFPADSMCKTAGPLVKIGPSNRQAVLHYLSQATPAGGTPTAAALNNAAQSLKDVGTETSTKYIILATDGGPNCNYLLPADPGCVCSHAAPEMCCTNHPQACYTGNTCLDETQTLQVILDLKDKDGIITFVIGLEGSAAYTGLLDAMALAGGAPKVGGATSYYPASSKAELQTALQTIAVSVISCEIDLQQKPDYPDKVLVYLDGKLVPRDSSNQDGWNYVDSTLTKIKLFGSFCSELQDGKQHSLTTTFACVVN